MVWGGDDVDAGVEMFVARACGAEREARAVGGANANDRGRSRRGENGFLAGVIVDD